MQGNRANDVAANALGDRCPDDAIEWFKYIEWEDLPKWEAIGWRLVAPFNERAALARWGGLAEPLIPD